MALTSPLDVCVTGKVRLIHLGFGIGGKCIGYQVPQAGMNNENRRVGSKEQVDVGTICLDGRIRSQDDSKQDSRLI